MSESKFETCKICGVIIENDAKVNFSCGKPGTRAKLWARVCQFANNPECINRDESKIGNIVETDYFN